MNHRFNYEAKSDCSGLFALPYFRGMKFSIKAWKGEEKCKPLTGISEEGLFPGTNCVELVFSTKDNFYLNFACKRASGEALVDFYIGVEGVEEVISEPFMITEHSETLQLSYTLNPL